MASSPSDLLKLELPATGEKDGAWGATINSNLQRLEEAIAGGNLINTTGGETTLTDTQFVQNEARYGLQRVQGTLTSNATIIMPDRSRIFHVSNETSGAYTVTIKASGGSSGVTITQGAVAMLYTDGSAGVFYLGAQAVRLTGAPQATGSGTIASSVGVTPTGNLTSTNAQSALSELQTDIDTINSGSGLSGKQDAAQNLTDIAGLTPAKGTVIVGDASNFTALTAGTDGYRLQADSAQTKGLKWAEVVVEGLDKTLGNLITADGSALAVIGIGTDGQVLTADSAEAYGIKWATPAAPANDSITNAMLADVPTATVKGRQDAGTGDPDDLTMTELATILTEDATALATLTAAIAPFDPSTDILGSTNAGTIVIPGTWATYMLFGYHVYGVNDDPDVLHYVSIYRSGVDATVETSQTVTDYTSGSATATGVTVSNFNRGFLIAIKQT